MSNLIKSVYFNVDPSETRVIDSDEKVEEFIPDIFKQEPKAEPFTFPNLEAQQLPEDGMQAEFEDGLSVIHMDDVVNQEREKVEQQMQEEKEQMLEKARNQADAMLEEAKGQVDSITESAYQEGMQKGLEDGRNQAEQELLQRQQELEQEYERRFSELEEQEKNLEPAFADLTISLVRKLTGILCEDKKGIILYLIGSAMRNLESTKSIVLRVSKADIGRITAKKATFQALAKGVSEFEIMEDDSLTENQCIIETDNKVIDCSLDAQLQNLEEHIKMLAF
ncbi:MAG: FliH/SctL family protein [Butyribacter sp.]|nr:FliH/SctL family protein [bacterium]MDY3855267.1 FliH/SctL family protein [Butyribacter sp.]